MKSHAIVIGDQHFKINNIPEVEEYIHKIEILVRDRNPDFIVLLGDMLDQHEKIHTSPLNKAFEFIDKMRNIAPTFVLVGNHDMTSNQNFLTTDHWLNALKEWENVTIVDNVIQRYINGYNFVFCPYVFSGRFEEALNSVLDDYWKKSKCIFCHQEFEGCKMGAIISVDGDRWTSEYPDVISGHIHKNQKIGSNIYYPGSSMQVSFGETDKNIVANVIFAEDKEYKLEEIEIDLPRKKILYMDVEELETFNIEKTKDKLKITISGSYEEFKTLKKTKKYKEITNDGIQIVFKSKKKEIRNLKDHIEEQLENQKSLTSITDGSNFRLILDESVKNEKNPYLFETFEYIINGRNVNHEDVIYI